MLMQCNIVSESRGMVEITSLIHCSSDGTFAEKRRLWIFGAKNQSARGEGKDQRHLLRVFEMHAPRESCEIDADFWSC